MTAPQHAATQTSGRERPIRADLPAAACQLRTVVLLAGAVRSNPLRRATGRSLLELPLESTTHVLDAWRHLLSDMAEDLAFDDLPARIMVDRGGPLVASTASAGAVRIAIEQDPSPYRGTAGLLRDVAAEYHDDDRMLVGNASQLPFDSLADLTRELASLNADITILCRENAEPAGLMLVRCGCLRDINRLGFVDFNEQALPQISQHHDVRVCCRPHPATRPIRTLPAYITALREYHQLRHPEARPIQQWEPAFSIIEPGAQIHPSALIHDSVVLAGASVGPSTVLVRSVVCPRAVLKRGQTAVNCFVANPDKRSGQR